MKSISPVRVFLSSLCVSTALCSVIPAAWGMDDDNKDHFFLTFNKEKQKHQDHKENQEKNRKKSFHKLTGRSLAIELLGEETRFYEEEVPYDGDCGYSALNISRQAATELLLQNIHGEDIQTLIAPEIYDMLPLLRETHPVLQLQAYQRLAQQDDLDRPYQEQVTSLNDLLNRTKEDGRDGDQLWGYCQQNLNSIQQNPLQNQSYLTFKSLREKIKQNEEERMQFCSQKETIECYIKNFMQIPVHTYFNQYEDNNWLNYSPILMQNQKHRTHAINAIAQLLGKNLIIFDEEGNIKHHYSSSEAPMGKDNTLLLRHIGNHHFNRLIFLEKNEGVEYLDFLRPKPILKEEVQDNSHEKGAQLFPSPILDFINCPVILDEGMKDLQKRLINIGNSYNKLTSLKKVLLQWINTPEKGENQNQIKEQLKKLIPLLLPPEELVITSEKGSLGMILEAFYHSKRKTEKDVVIHSAFGAINDRIERCENFASRVEIYSKENSLVLREIKAIYEMYRQGFLLFNIQDEYSLRLMSKDPSLEEMKKIEPGELGIFCKDGGLYCKITEQENILQIIKSDDPKVGLHPDIFEKFLSASQKIDSNDKKALLQYTLLKGYTLQDLENEYKKYLASKAELYGTLLSSPSLIQQSIAYQLVSRTLFNKVDKQNKEGTHAVRSFEGMHFKVYDYDSELGLCPGKELAMYHLYQLLIGEGVAPSTLVCIGELPFVDLEKAGIKKQVNQALSEGKDIGDLILENPNILHQIEGNKTKALYPIQVSATIEGMGFHTFLENHFFAEWKKKNLNQDPKAYLLEDHGGNSFRLGFQHRFAEFIIPKTIKDKGSKNIKEQKWNNFLQTFNPNDWSLEHIDEESFARMTLMSFLTDPGDSKADNFMIYRKSKKENNQKWHIISIDTDRVFEPNLHEIESGTKKGHHKVHHKSLFYTLPFFMKEKSLSQKIKNEFKAMNVPLILAKWLLTLREGNKAYASLQKESALPEKVYTSMKLPVTFKKGQVLTLLRRLQDLQNIVTHHDFNLTLDRTFELMHPVLYAYYEKLYHLYPDDPLARIYEDNARENNQELTVESVLKEEGLSQKDEEGRSFKDLLQEFNEIEGNTQNSKTLEKNHQTIDEALDEFSQQIKQQGKKESLLDLILEANDADLFKRLINAQGLQAINPNLGRRFYHSIIKKNQGDLELKKAWELLVNHPHNAKLHWYMGLDHLFLSPQEAKHKITSATEGEKYLPQEVWDQLINEKNEFKRQNQDGAHAVGKATHNGYTLYFKFLPKLPGLEEAVGRWTRNLIGFGAPHVELFRLDTDPVLVSQEIKGLTLKDTIQKHPERLQQLDPKSLSQIILTTMLVNPEDGRPDNYIVEQTSENPPLYRIIGVDNDQAFVPAVAREQKKGWGKSQTVVQVKCILYCLDQMDQPIHQETREYFKNLDPQLLLSTWLNEVDLVHQRQIELFANTKDNNALLKKLFQEHDSYVGVPFKKGDLHEFYDRFLRLQKALHDPEVKTYHDLLMRVEPRLGRRYGELRHNPNKYPKDLYEKFKVIDGEYFSETMGTLTSGKDTLRGKGISEKEVLEDIIKRDRHYTPKLALKELERRVDEMAKMEISSLLQAQEGNIEAFASEEFRNKFFQNTDFTHAKLDPEGKTYGPVSVNTQQALLKGLTPYDLHDLTLVNCQAFTLPILEKQLKIQGLTHVNLRGCSGVTSQVPIYLSGQCSGLIQLDLSGCKYLIYIAGRAVASSPLVFSSLQKLYLNECVQLDQINIKADQLLLLEAQNNPILRVIKVQSPTLKLVNINKNLKITDQMLDELGEHSPNLATIICKECPQLRFAEFREQFPLCSQSKIDKKILQEIKEAYEKKLAMLSFTPDYVEKSKIDSEVAKVLGKITTFTGLYLSWNNIGDVGAEFLSKNTTLKKLFLFGSNIRDAGAASFSKNTTLTLLSICGGNVFRGYIGDVGAESLSKNTTLTSLDLERNKIKDVGAEFLSKNTTLKSLNLSWNKIGDVGAEWLSKNTTLRILDLHWNTIGDVGVKFLSKNITLKMLDLSSNNIRAVGIKALFKNTTLTSLCLGGNKVGDVGAKFLSKNTTLTELDIHRNKIGAIGAEFLSKNMTLTKLVLWGNKVGDVGAKFLSKNTTLTELDLNNNNITDVGAQALSKNATLTSLNLRQNNITDVGAKALAKSTTLTSLNLSDQFTMRQFFQEIMHTSFGGGSSDETTKLIEEMLERNKKRKKEEQNKKNNKNN